MELTNLETGLIFYVLIFQASLCIIGVHNSHQFQDSSFIVKLLSTLLVIPIIGISCIVLALYLVITGKEL